jgi:phenylacetyl-CoA:acceptor oxidoreductase 26-kDa subunit
MSYGPKPWLQTNWDIRAALNFICGGVGGGLLVVTALFSGQQEAPLFQLALGAALIGAGLFSVWLEIGRPLRAINVYFNARTSWMTREALVALAVFALIAATALGQRGAAPLLALAALLFVYAQGRMLRAAMGIPAWRDPMIPTLIVTTALAEGGGLFLVVGSLHAGVTVLAIAFAGFAAFSRFLAWVPYRRQVETSLAPAAWAALAHAQMTLGPKGTGAVLALYCLALLFPDAQAPLAVIGGLIAVAAGTGFKLVLITRAAHNQGFSLPHLPVRGRS